MAIKQSVKEKIIIAWKNGDYTTLRPIAKAFNISAPAVTKILKKAGVYQSNGENKAVVNLGVEYKKALYLDGTRTQTEINVIDEMVNEIIDIEELKNEAEKYSIAITVKNLREMGTKVAKNEKDVFIKGDKYTIDKVGQMGLDFNDHKLVQDTVDKAMITIGKADRHSTTNTAVQINTADQTGNNQGNLTLSFEGNELEDEAES